MTEKSKTITAVHDTTKDSMILKIDSGGTTAQIYHVPREGMPNFIKQQLDVMGMTLEDVRVAYGEG